MSEVTARVPPLAAALLLILAPAAKVVGDTPLLPTLKVMPVLI